MKLAICVIHNRDRNKLTDDLIRSGFKFTVIGSSGGFLREGNTTLLIGLEQEELGSLEQIIAKNCPSREQVVNVAPADAVIPGTFVTSPFNVPVGGAVFFLLNVEKFERF